MAEYIRQMENKRSQGYQQTTPDPLLLNRYTDNQRPQKYNNEERFENLNPQFTGFFQGQAKLNTGRVAGYNYSACTKVAFKNQPANQNLENDISLLNHRI